MGEEQAYSYSFRGIEALKKGLKPLDEWTMENLVSKAIHIKLANKPCPMIIFDELRAIPVEILRNRLLIKMEWHHRSFKPTWFYGIDEEAVKDLTMNDIKAMKEEAEMYRQIASKPKWAAFRISASNPAAWSCNSEICRFAAEREG